MRVAFQCAFVYSSARIKSGAMTKRLKAAVFWKNRDIKFFCFIKRRMRKYYFSVITKVSQLGSFVVHRLSATGLTLAANYLFLFYIKLMDLSSKQRILEVTSSLEFHISRFKFYFDRWLCKWNKYIVAEGFSRRSMLLYLDIFYLFVLCEGDDAGRM